MSSRCSAFYNTTMRALTEAAPTLCNRLLHNCRGRNVCLLESVRDPAARRWYVRQAIERGRARFDKRGLSRVILDEDWRQSVSRRRRADVTEAGHTTRKRAFVDCLALPGPSPPGEAVAADLVRSTLRLMSNGADILGAVPTALTPQPSAPCSDLPCLWWRAPARQKNQFLTRVGLR